MDDDLYFVSWEDRDLDWVTEQFGSHREAEDFAAALLTNREATEVEIR